MPRGIASPTGAPSDDGRLSWLDDPDRTSPRSTPAVLRSVIVLQAWHRRPWGAFGGHLRRNRCGSTELLYAL
jgi:hypothetical protein